MNLLKKKVFNAKITEIESKMRRITSLATTAALTRVRNKIPDVSNLVKKNTHYDAEVLETKSKWFTTADYNKFATEKLDLKIKQKGLVRKSDIARFKSNADLDKRKKSSKITNKSKI